MSSDGIASRILYLLQGVVFYSAFVCLSASLSHCLLAHSRKTYWWNLYENFITHIDLGYLCTRKSPLHFGSIRSPVSGSGVRIGTGSPWRRSALSGCSCLKSNVYIYAFWQAEGSAFISRSILYVRRSPAYPHSPHGRTVTRFSHLFSAILRVLGDKWGYDPLSFNCSLASPQTTVYVSEVTRSQCAITS